MKHFSKNIPQRLGFYTQKVVKPVFKARGLMEGKIIIHWSQIVGESFSRLALAEKITFPKGKKTEGTLHLSVTSASAFLLQYAQDLILERVNTFFGYKALSNLKMTHDLPTPKEKQPLQPSPPLSLEDEEWLESLMGEIQDQDLKVHLEKLGEGVCRAK